jgi:glyoxylate reductase
VAGSVFVTRPIPEPGPELLRLAADRVDINPDDRSLTPEELRAAVAGRDAVLCLLTDRIDRAVLDAARGCRVIANMAVGHNNVDLAAATARGILVTNTPDVLTDATADLTWALILSVARRVVEGDRVMRAGEFRGWGPLYMLGTEVTGATLGLIGPGRIAAAVARRAAGFRMPVLYHGRRPSPELDALGARSCGLEELLRSSDFVSLHVPLTDATRHMIDARALALMKPTAFLINTARGPVVDEAALVEALRAGRIAGAGLDVYEREPRMAEGLAGCGNAVLLPHLGSATRATRAAMARIAAQNVAAVLRGQRPPNLVNPEAWPESADRPAPPAR